MNFDDPNNPPRDSEDNSSVRDCLERLSAESVEGHTPDEPSLAGHAAESLPGRLDAPDSLGHTSAPGQPGESAAEGSRLAEGAASQLASSPPPAAANEDDQLARTDSRSTIPVAGSGGNPPIHLAASTLLSLLMVLALLLIARLVVPSLVESIRYGWHRGELRAEYELSGQRLRNVSLDSLADVSQLVSQRVGPSLVHVNLLRDADAVSQFQAILGDRHPSARLEGQGSGFVIDSTGYILTNHHVIDDVGSIEVTLSDGRQLPATIVGADPPTDLAVLKVEAGGLMAVDWGDSEEVVVGTPVWAAGSPFGLQQTVTFGIISGKHRVDFRGTRYEESVYGGTAYGDLMQSDVALNPGNSGGPLVNSMGQVVGVNAAILGETYRGISFSIPSRVARKVAAHLIQDGEVPRGWLGVRMQDLATNERYGDDGKVIPGVRVVGFPKGSSPARDAGLAVGDTIIAYDGQDVLSQVELMKMIGETAVGDSASVTVSRDGESRVFEVVIGKREIGY